VAETFTHPVQVRYLEVDQQGVVFNMWYLAYVDDAMTAFMTHLGRRYQDLTASGFDFQIVHASLDWRAGVGFGDPVRVSVRVEKVGNTSMTLVYDVLKNDDSVVTATVVYVCVRTDGSGKTSIPAALRERLEAYRS
jgi:acyl-CoA thioester hydrolase